MPKSEVTISIPIANLRELPPEAEYRDKNGQTDVRVRNRGDTIIVTAQCDSLQRLCEYYEETMRRNDTMSDNRSHDIITTEKHQTDIIKTVFAAFIAGVATGIVLTILIKRIWKKVYWTAPT